MDKKYKDCCWDCGNTKYLHKRDMGAIGVSIRKCPVCKKIKGVIPARDWAFRSGNLEKWL